MHIIQTIRLVLIVAIVVATIALAYTAYDVTHQKYIDFKTDVQLRLLPAK